MNRVCERDIERLSSLHSKYEFSTNINIIFLYRKNEESIKRKSLVAPVFSFGFMIISESKSKEYAFYHSISCNEKILQVLFDPYVCVLFDKLTSLTQS